MPKLRVGMPPDRFIVVKNLKSTHRIEILRCAQNDTEVFDRAIKTAKYFPVELRIKTIQVTHIPKLLDLRSELLLRRVVADSLVGAPRRVKCKMRNIQ